MKYDAVSTKLNDVAMNGFAEEEYGSCQEEGFWAALIVADSLYGIILGDDQGFIDYEVHDTEDAVRGRWNDMMDKWESIFNPEAAYA